MSELEFAQILERLTTTIKDDSMFNNTFGKQNTRFKLNLTQLERHKSSSSLGIDK